MGRQQHHHKQHLHLRLAQQPRLPRMLLGRLGPDNLHMTTMWSLEVLLDQQQGLHLRLQFRHVMLLQRLSLSMRLRHMTSRRMHWVLPGRLWQLLRVSSRCPVWQLMISSRHLHWQHHHSTVGKQ
jgi:hypothetical protein